jgi:single-stranded-DNA-specific exonuclease
MTADELPEGLLERVSMAVDSVREFSQVRLISHYDADGISSAGVLSNSLLKAGIGIHVTLAKSLDEEMIEKLSSEGHDCIVFSDMGSGMLQEMESLNGRVVVLDHHRPRGDSDKVIHVNPHLWGIDGMTGSSASAICMLFAIEMNEGNWPLLPVAFAGIAGDRQDIRELSGINAWLLDGGRSRNLVEVRNRSLFPRGSLGEMEKRFEPYLLGVSGSEKGATSILEKAGLTSKEQGDSIDERKRRKLASLLALSLLEQGVEPSTLDELTGKTYYFPAWDMEAGELASLLNACGRMAMDGIGLSLTLGDPQALEKARDLKADYDSEVLVALNGIEDRIEQMDNIQYFHNQNPSLSGVVCGITMQYIADKNKPTLALAEKSGKLRVSSRATFSLLERGVDLSEALRRGAESAGGLGGGHAIASGATVQSGKEKEFLEAVNSIVGEQKVLKKK